MSGFKLLALQPLENCNRDLIKKLEINQLYQFYQDYSFILDENGLASEITNSNNDLFNLYSTNEPFINISAIVGKNGSGKSTILELLALLCLCLSKRQKNIKVEIQINKRKKEISEALSVLNIEVFYATSDISSTEIIYSIRCKNGNIKLFEFNTERKEIESPNILKKFFYTIVSNYSLHGLNEIYTPWLAPLFHKNDGYQAPIVINPHREDGIIDVNKELDLANYRLIQNIIEANKSKFEIIKNTYVDSVKFSLNPDKLNWFYWDRMEFSVVSSVKYLNSNSEFNIYKLVNLYISKLNEKRKAKEKYLPLLTSEKIKQFNTFDRENSQSIFGKLSILNINQSNSEYLEYFFVKYIIRKIFRLYLIVTKNPSYSNTLKMSSDKNQFDHFIVLLNEANEIEGFIRQLVNDNSHLTLKLRQMVFVLSSNFFIDQKIFYGFSKEKNKITISFTLTLQELFNYSYEVESQYAASDLEKIPGGIFEPTIKLLLPTTNLNEIVFLSSGELQFLYSIHTILYHLRNIDSVHKGNQKNKYKNVNIVLDEIEICFHPDFQRKFINELIRNIKNLNIQHIQNINILFSTHSPFILSDIPSQNILHLEDGKPSDKLYYQTFGANIHDLLSNDFYLKEGFMGEFSKGKILDVIENLQNDENYIPKNKIEKEDIKQIIELIGEPFLKDKLMAMFEQKFKENDIYDIEIEKLKAKIIKYETLKSKTNDSIKN